MIRRAFAIVGLVLAASPAAAEAPARDDSLSAYRLANRCFAITDAKSKVEATLSARFRLEQLLFWGTAASEFGKAAKLSDNVQRQDMEAAASKADAEFARKDPKAEQDLMQCENAFRTAMAK